MIEPDEIKILETHEDAEQPYQLIQEIFIHKSMVNGELQETRSTRLVSKNIRSDDEVKTPELTKEEVIEQKLKVVRQQRAALKKANAGLKKPKSRIFGKSEESAAVDVE